MTTLITSAKETKAPSTRIQIFLNPQLFLSGYGYRPHAHGEFASKSGNFFNPLSRVEIFESDNISDTCGTVESRYFLIRCRHKIGARNLSRKFKQLAADRRQIASVLLGLISSLLACMQLNVAQLNAEISYARRRLDICKLFTLSTGQNGRQKQLKRVGEQCRPRRFWVRPGRTSAWWDNFVNPQWIRSESEYVWTGEFDMNTLWSHNVWTRIFSYPEKKVAD